MARREVSDGNIIKNKCSSVKGNKITRNQVTYFLSSGFPDLGVHPGMRVSERTVFIRQITPIVQVIATYLCCLLSLSLDPQQLIRVTVNLRSL